MESASLARTAGNEMCVALQSDESLRAKNPLQPLRKSRHLAIDETFAFTYDGANLIPC